MILHRWCFQLSALFLSLSFFLALKYHNYYIAIRPIILVIGIVLISSFTKALNESGLDCSILL